jgi:16S rRNA (uracil1498-N3)-methyltransferase
MDRYDFRTPRLFIDAPLSQGIFFELGRAQANYLLNVLRLGNGGRVLVFNGRDGEWLAVIAAAGRKKCSLMLEQQTREQPLPGGLLYCFAPLKKARLDYMVQKAVEMGADALQPVITEHTQVAKPALDRMRANAIEAAEQCGILAIPEICEPVRLGRLLAGWDSERTLVFCDELAVAGDPAAALSRLRGRQLAVLIGPEGGFSGEERAALAAAPFVVPISLGPRILRADTAAVAALALVQSVAGDWNADHQ